MNDPQRRALVIGVPVVAATGGLLVFAALKDTSPRITLDDIPPVSPPELAGSAHAATLQAPQGAITITARNYTDPAYTSNFPDASTALTPSSLLAQACMNGDALSICINHLHGGRHRSIMLQFKSAVEWAVASTQTFDMADTRLTEGCIFSLPDPAAASPKIASAAGRYAYKMASGKARVSVSADGWLTLVLAPEYGSDIVAQAQASHSVNAARDSISISNATPEAQRTVKLPLLVENELSV